MFVFTDEMFHLVGTLHYKVQTETKHYLEFQNINKLNCLLNTSLKENNNHFKIIPLDYTEIMEVIELKVNTEFKGVLLIL